MDPQARLGTDEFSTQHDEGDGEERKTAAVGSMHMDTCKIKHEENASKSDAL